MDSIVLNINLRDQKGSNSVRKVRKNGLTPAVVYGNFGNKVIAVDTVDFESTIKKYKSINTIVFDLKCKEDDSSILSIISEIQRHPLTNEIYNIDFKEVSLKEKVAVDVPLVTYGDCVGIKLGGILEQHMWSISIECLPNAIPEEYRVDISALTVGDFLHVSELPEQEGINIVSNEKDLVLAIVASRKSLSAEATEESSSTEPEVTKQKNVNSSE